MEAKQRLEEERNAGVSTLKLYKKIRKFLLPDSGLGSQVPGMKEHAGML